MKKRYLILAGLLVMTVAAAGCGKKKTPRGILPVNSNERTTMLLWQSFLISLWSYLIYFYSASFIRSSTHSSSDKTEVFRQIS